MSQGNFKATSLFLGAGWVLLPVVERIFADALAPFTGVILDWWWASAILAAVASYLTYLGARAGWHTFWYVGEFGALAMVAFILLSIDGTTFGLDAASARGAVEWCYALVHAAFAWGIIGLFGWLIKLSQSSAAQSGTD